MKTKIYTQSPLPFMGQKKNFLKEFKRSLNSFDKYDTFVDLFGGSGLLSHTIKRERPNANVIYNDYDDFHLRLENVKTTNIILDNLRTILDGCPRQKNIGATKKSEVINYLKKMENQYGYIDYITLSASLLFSMNYSENIEGFLSSSLYNCVRKTNYETAGYLDGLTIVKMDYKELFNEYYGKPYVVFLVDPPYLSTDVSVYKNYWNLSEYLDVLKVLQNTSYFYFTSNKSSIVELCNWLEENLRSANPFAGSTTKTMTARASYNASYTDIMIYKNETSSNTDVNYTSSSTL